MYLVQGPLQCPDATWEFTRILSQLGGPTAVARAACVRTHRNASIMGE